MRDIQIRACGDYEADRARRPLYHDGTPRPEWARLSSIARESWIKGAARDLQNEALDHLLDDPWPNGRDEGAR
jgi:hypothetical protein